MQGHKRALILQLNVMISALSHSPDSGFRRFPDCEAGAPVVMYGPCHSITGRPFPRSFVHPFPAEIRGDYFITFSKTINNPSPREFCGKLSSHCPLMGENPVYVSLSSFSRVGRTGRPLRCRRKCFHLVPCCVCR